MSSILIRSTNSLARLVESGFFLGALLLAGCLPVAGERPDQAAEKPAVAKPAVPPPPACAGLPKRKVLVTAFPLRYPEQLKSGEFMGWAQVTGEEVWRTLMRGNRLLAAPATQQFPFASAEQAPELEQRQGKPVIGKWVEQEQAQYVVAGLFHDFGMAKQLGVVPQRQMRAEAFIYDARGALLARQEFSRQLLLGGELPKSVAPGTREFAASRLGETYNELIVEMARWIEDTTTCLPFAVRVAHVEDRKLHLDLGADRGIVAGMAFQSWLPGSEPPQKTPYARVLPTAVVKTVAAGTSIAEIPQQRTPPTVKAGDLLYLAK